jgi:GTPase SAR1 family protein
LFLTYILFPIQTDGKLVNLQLWDIPGNERFGGLTRVHYKYAHGALLVFDLSRPDETFDAALRWLSDVTQKLFDEKQRLEEAIDDDTVKTEGGGMQSVKTFSLFIRP